MKKLSALLMILGFFVAVNAQAPYRHSIGVTGGNLNAFSYKTFFTDHLAFSIDAGYKWTHTVATYHEKGTNYAFRHGGFFPTTIEVNPNLMYEAPTNAGGLHWFVGGGVSGGYSWATSYDGYYGYYKYYYGKIGVNAIGGVEYKFNIPLTLQADFRPGFGLMFNKHYDIHYFDWGVNVGVRYTIQ